MEGQDPGFQNWLEQQLQGSAGAQVGPHPLATQATYHQAFLTGGISMTGSTGLIAALSGKLAAGVAAGGLVVGGGSAVAASHLTGTTDPSVWGKTVTAAVQTCKDKAAAANQHGIGRCVSAVAKQKGEQEKAAHAKDKTRGGDSGESSEPSPRPSGRPSEVPGGPPSGVPAGRPSIGVGGPPSGVPGSPRR